MYASESWKNKVHDIERLESVDDADQVNVWGNTEGRLHQRGSNVELGLKL